MAKVVITIVDLDDGGVNLSVEFDPVIKTDDDGECTQAQETAIKMVESVKSSISTCKCEELEAELSRVTRILDRSEYEMEQLYMRDRSPSIGWDEATETVAAVFATVRK